LEGEVIDKLKLASHDAAAASEAVELLRGAAPGAIERMNTAIESASASLAAIEQGAGGKKGNGDGGGGSPARQNPPPPKAGTGPGALLSSLYDVATGGIGGGGSKQRQGR